MIHKQPPLSFPPELPQDLCVALLRAGLFPSLLAEVARSEQPAEDLWALLRWCETQSDTPAALFIARLRLGAVVPEQYYQPPCDVCGEYGGEHEPNCRRRYLAGRYAEWIEH